MRHCRIDYLLYKKDTLKGYVYTEYDDLSVAEHTHICHKKDFMTRHSRITRTVEIHDNYKVIDRNRGKIEYTNVIASLHLPKMKISYGIDYMKGITGIVNQKNYIKKIYNCEVMDSLDIRISTSNILNKLREIKNLEDAKQVGKELLKDRIKLKYLDSENYPRLGITSGDANFISSLIAYLRTSDDCNFTYYVPIMMHYGENYNYKNFVMIARLQINDKYL